MIRDGTKGAVRRPRRERGRRRRLILTAYALWVVLVLLASVPYLAQTGTRKVVGDGEYEYHPTFESDGNIDHYYVERADTSLGASIDLRYHMAERSVEIDAKNIVKLSVDCSSIARKHSVELMNIEYSEQPEAFHKYFYDMGYLEVDAVTTHDMEVKWKHMPVPTAVVADGEPYDGEWLQNGDDIVVDVPAGTHSYVLYFEDAPQFPTAVIGVDHARNLVGKEVTFDGSGSIGGEGDKGAIEDYLWDFGEGGGTGAPDASGVEASHTYNRAGTYTVSLTVRNGYHLKDTAAVEVIIRSADPSIDQDGDGDPDWSDPDIDGDGFSNEDEERLGTKDDDPNSIPPDMDGDKTADSEDDDIDGDGVQNDVDAFPNDVSKWKEPEKGGDGGAGSGTVGMLAMVVVLIIVGLLFMVVMKKRKKAAEAPVEGAVAIEALEPAARAPTVPAPPRPGTSRPEPPYIPSVPVTPVAAVTSVPMVEARPVAVLPAMDEPEEPEEAEAVVDDGEGELAAEVAVLESELDDDTVAGGGSGEGDMDGEALLEAELEAELEMELKNGGGLFAIDEGEAPVKKPVATATGKPSFKKPAGVAVKRPVSGNGMFASMPKIRQPAALKLKTASSGGSGRIHVSKPPSLEGEAGEPGEGDNKMSARDLYLARKNRLNGNGI